MADGKYLRIPPGIGWTFNSAGPALLMRQGASRATITSFDELADKASLRQSEELVFELEADDFVRVEVDLRS